MRLKERNFHLAIVLALAATIGSCTSTVLLREPITGKTVKCGGGIWSPTAPSADQHCLDYWHHMGYTPIQ
jgi:hypothetical protein